VSGPKAVDIKMPIEITRLTESDIPGAVTAIQEAFKDDPYNNWVYNNRAKLDLNRNRVSLGIRCRWGVRNALFYVAKDTSANDKVLGIAMWMPPRPSALKETWGEWFEGWKMWAQQVRMNIWYGRGGLNVKVRVFVSLSVETKHCQTRGYVRGAFALIGKADFS